MKKIILLSIAVLFLFTGVDAQKKKASPKQEVANDTNTPLHLLQPDFKVPYGIPSTDEVKADIDRILHFLEGCTPARIVDKNTGAQITDYSKIDENSQLERGSFRLTSYEWGVTYSAMLAAAKITGDQAYYDYAFERMKLLAETAPYFAASYEKTGLVDQQMRPVIEPHALDDCGAICAAMVKAQYPDNFKKSTEVNLMDQINRYFNYIMYWEYRLPDGTLARNRPMDNSIWLDDMFMGIPAIAWYGRTARVDKNKYLIDAARQIMQYKERMWVPEKQLFRHAWIESMGYHPSFHWARANGWAMLAMCEVLDVMPAGAERNKIMDLFVQHINGVMALQSPEGFWHQLLDRPESYLETSATAIYTYCIAHAINQGWIDAKAYGPTALLGWNAVKTKITPEGLVEGTCVGTGMGFDVAFYCARPVSSYAAHGYGPAILAGAEMIRLLQNQNPHYIDSGVLFYQPGLVVEKNIMFGTSDPNNRDDLYICDKREGSKPVLFLVGDSTMAPGSGWGDEGAKVFDETKITAVNCGIGGLSTRTFLEQGYWAKVLDAIRPGDFVLFDLGQNDDWDKINTGKARASMPGNSDEGQMFVMSKNGREEMIYSYGHYLRKMGIQARAKGATVIFTSYTAWNNWKDGVMEYEQGNNFAVWTEEAAKQIGVTYIDLFNYDYKYYSSIGFEKTQPYFIDDSHLTKLGAEFTAKHFAEQLRETDSPLKDYLK